MESCFCIIHQHEMLSYYKSCINCEEKLCEMCLDEKTCSCEGINDNNSSKITYINRGDILFEMCTNHIGYQCHFYCITCKQYICVLCESFHKQKMHKIILIDAYINLQKKNINTQRNNLEKVRKSLQEKRSKIDSIEDSIQEYTEKLMQKILSLKENFLKTKEIVVEEKSRHMESQSLAEIQDLRTELVNLKLELEKRKKFNEYFKNFIKDENNINLLQFIEAEEFFKENVEFANQIIERINQNKKYYFYKLLLKKKENLPEVKLKKVQQNSRIVIDEFKLPFTLIENETP